ncbi:MAG: LysR family transcriptional regulator substrate-binding protein [Burkholderiaceae bacterium]
MLLTRLVAEYHRIEPDVMLQVIEAPSPVLQEMLLTGRLDIALLTDPAVDDRITSRPLWRERLFLVTPAGRAPTAAGLAGLPFALPTRDPKIAELIERALRRFGLPFHFDLEIASAASVKHLIGTDGAYSVLPYSAVTDVPPDIRLALHRVPDLWIRRSIAWRSATPLRLEAERLILTLEQLVEERCAADPNGDLRREHGASPRRKNPRRPRR